MIHTLILLYSQCYTIVNSRNYNGSNMISITSPLSFYSNSTLNNNAPHETNNGMNGDFNDLP